MYCFVCDFGQHGDIRFKDGAMSNVVDINSARKPKLDVNKIWGSSPPPTGDMLDDLMESNDRLRAALLTIKQMLFRTDIDVDGHILVTINNVLAEE